jgi:predicted GH43/DUF377 family glycosyl hydrolase
MTAYVVEGLADVSLDITGLDGRLDHADLMSPFVWKEGAHYRMMVRVLPHPLGPTDPTGVIWCGASTDGLYFVIDKEPSIIPGPDPIDSGGCEDPTVVQDGQGSYLVYYTGVDAKRQQGSLLVARGSDLRDLKKVQGILKAPAGEGNIKEATLAQARDGSFRLFYEYARDNASRIGMVRGPGADGPWTVVDDPFTIREDSWDNWHLSTGPMIDGPGGDHVMFYNGATIDARWRIGWIAFSPDFSKVTGRGIEPILMLPPAQDRSAADIAFAASCVIEGADIFLYYSLEDSILRRATIRRYD